MIFQATFFSIDEATKLHEALGVKIDAGERTILRTLRWENLLFLATRSPTAQEIFPYIESLRADEYRQNSFLLDELTQNFRGKAPDEFIVKLRELHALTNPPAQPAAALPPSAIMLVNANSSVSPFSKIPEDVLALKDMIGLGHVKDQVPGMIRGINFRHSIKERGNKVDIQPNLLIMGPTGAGKKTLAQALAYEFCQPGGIIPPDAPIMMGDALHLVGDPNDFQPSIRRIVESAQKGVLIIHNIEKLIDASDSSQAAQVFRLALRLAYVYARSSAAPPIIIATCNSAQQNELPKAGISTGHTFYLNKYEDSDLMEIFFQKAELAGLERDENVDMAVRTILSQVKAHATSPYQGAHAVDAVFGAILNATAVRDEKATTIITRDVPDRYESATSSFIPNNPTSAEQPGRRGLALVTPLAAPR